MYVNISPHKNTQKNTLDNFDAIRSLQKFLHFENIPMTRDCLIDLSEAPAAAGGNKDADTLARVLQRSRETRRALQYILTIEQNYGVVIMTDAARRSLAQVNADSPIVSSGSADSLRSAESEFDDDESSPLKRRVVPPLAASGTSPLAPLSPNSSMRTPGGPQLPVEMKKPLSPVNSSRNLHKTTSNASLQRLASPSVSRERTPEELRIEWHAVLQAAGVPAERIASVANVMVFELIEPSQLSLLDPKLLQSLSIAESDANKILAWHANRK